MDSFYITILASLTANKTSLSGVLLADVSRASLNVAHSDWLPRGSRDSYVTDNDARRRK